MNVDGSGNSALERKSPLVLAAAVVLAVLTYLPFVDLPPLPDDYLQLELAMRYGPVANWGELAADPLYRSRATSILVSYWSLQVLGFSPWMLNLTSLLLHALNTALVYGLGASPLIGRRVAALAALLFAVRERHHEAVVWYAALPELLVFTFSLLCLASWIRWLKTNRDMLDWRWVAALSAFVAALFSKESAVAVVPLLALFAWPYYRRERDIKLVFAIVPFALAGMLNAVAIFAGASGNQHFSDGTFRLTLAFPVAFLNSAVRGFWIWASLAALLILVTASGVRARRLLGLACFWVAFTLLPYSFVTYMPRIPSRHHYFASLGFALLIAMGMLVLGRVARRPWLPAAAAWLFIAHNVGYLWLQKREPFVARAAPIETLLQRVGRAPHRPYRVSCFPVSFEEAKRAVTLQLHEPPDAVALSADGESFCTDEAR
jgi:hypothetical protein